MTSYNASKYLGINNIGKIEQGYKSNFLVLDKNLKLQGLKDIYCCSSAIFPTSGSVNPTLIICALSERLSSHLMIK